MTGKVAALFAPIIKAAKLAAWPVGSIYMSMVATNPGTLFGGTWVRMENRFLLGAGSGYAAGATGGEATHKLTTSEMPSHRHDLFSNTFAWGVTSGFASPVKVDTAIATAGYPTGNSLVTDQGASRFTNYSGSNNAHNNMPPYIAVYMWRRTA